MDGALVKSLAVVAIGVFLLRVGWNNWRHRHDDRAIPWLEREMLGFTDEKPLPRTGFDRASRYAQAALGLGLGSFLAVAGLAGFLTL